MSTAATSRRCCSPSFTGRCRKSSAGYLYIATAALSGQKGDSETYLKDDPEMEEYLIRLVAGKRC